MTTAPTITVDDETRDDCTAILPPANARPTPRRPSLAADLPPGHGDGDAHARTAGGSLAADQGAVDTHEKHASGERGIDHVARDSHLRSVDLALMFYSALLDDIEDLRKRTASRALNLAAEGAPTTTYEQTVEQLNAMEHQAVLALQRAMRQHPYGPWVNGTVGIGEKQGARLIAAIGDPYWNALEERPRRGPAELWAYCGYAPGQKRAKGVKSNWNADAKMRAFLCAESCIKQMHSPYRPVYDAARLAWAERETSELHKHNHALRLVAKEILKDLWRFGHELALDHTCTDAHRCCVGGNDRSERDA